MSERQKEIKRITKEHWKHSKSRKYMWGCILGLFIIFGLSFGSAYYGGGILFILYCLWRFIYYVNERDKVERTV